MKLSPARHSAARIPIVDVGDDIVATFLTDEEEVITWVSEELAVCCNKPRQAPRPAFAIPQVERRRPAVIADVVERVVKPVSRCHDRLLA